MTTSTILIVDDEPSNLASLKQILGSLYSLTFARSGTECLAAAKKHHPALILLDIQMPDMDGYSVCRQLKADPATESTPVIFVSSLKEVGDEAAGFECGGVDYIVKPVSPALVLARVRTHLSLVRATMLQPYIEQLEQERATIARLSRIHAVMSGTNSAIVRINDSQALFEEACRIAVRQGGFDVAWIGIVDPDKQNLALAACEGADEGELRDLLAESAMHGAQGIGIPADTLKSGTAVFCNDLRASDHPGRVGLHALLDGYLSLIALPLAITDKSPGVLVLYAREANYFDDQELKLLRELAGDISFALQAIENEKRASFLSYFDPLTALPNTALFLDRLAQLIQAADRDHQLVFVITLNLDRFKVLNDSIGRDVGDQVLRTVARRLTEGIGQPCSVARTGADNFVIAGEALNNESVNELCEKILGLFAEPLVVADKNIPVVVRLGIAVWPTEADDAENLFKHAEAALKQSKSLKAPYMFYSPEINARIAKKIEMEYELKTALEQNQLLLQLQPKVNLATGRIIGAEALVLWSHPERGVIYPTEFIPLAEETGLIVPLGAWVLDRVCALQATWGHSTLRLVPIAVNLSPVQFDESAILQTVREALDKHAIDPAMLELEITESLVMQNPEKSGRIMRAFRTMGVSLALDDFGTGFSSLAYLTRFPFDTVKIDRAFITHIIEKPDDAAIASAIISMAHTLRMRVVAEGIETEAQAKFMRAKNCDEMQGYLFSRPVSPDEFWTLLREDRRLRLEVDETEQAETVLVVNGGEDLSATLKRIGEDEGYQILYARGGQGAMDVLAENSVQAIVWHQVIPSEREQEFLSIVSQFHPNIPRILLGDHTDVNSVLDSFNRSEIFRYVPEAWDEEELRQNIRDAIRRHYRKIAESQ